MRLLKFLSVCLLIFTSTTLIQSCSGSCQAVECEYDGVCDGGDCVCSDVTENYLLGTWDLLSTSGAVGTFEKDNVYVDSFGNVVSWSLDASTNTITLTPGNILIISEDGFSCSRMNVMIDNGTTITDFVFLRQ